MRAPTVRVRAVRGGDVERCRALWLAGLDQTTEQTHWLLRPAMRRMMARLASNCTAPGGDMSNVVAHWTGGDRTFLVAVDASDGEAVLGCVAVTVGDTDAPPTTTPQPDTGRLACSVWRMSVDDAARRRGVGAELMRAAEGWGASRGCRTLHLQTGNSAAAAFYQRLGYTRTPWTFAWYSRELR
jgi:GNAT superfamily N-acetyltransferase